MNESKPMSVAQVRRKLKRNDKKQVYQTIDNCLIVLRNDPVLKGGIRQNLLTDRQDIVRGMGWTRTEPSITDTDYQYLLHYFEHNYGLSSEKKVLSAVKIIANENRYHPVQDYLSALKWDGQERLPHVLTKYLGADACAYTTEALKLFMLGAVSRVFEPGCKFDYMLCLVGGQGAGKSTFFRFLAIKDQWFTDDLKSIEKEDVFEQLAGHFIVEMSEMLATANAKSIEAIKSFVSRQSEIYRTRYDRYAKDRPRQCVFGGTSNNMDFLPLDRTGNRRFLPILLHPERAEKHLLEDPEEARACFDQLWAEVMVIYRSKNFALELPKSIRADAAKLQREFMPEDSKTGIIQQFLDNFKGHHVCTRLLYRDVLKKGFTEPQAWELKEISTIMNSSIEGWEKCGNQRYGEFGSQRSWRRIPNTPATVQQLSMNEDFPIIESEIPAQWLEQD